MGEMALGIIINLDGMPYILVFILFLYLCYFWPKLSLLVSNMVEGRWELVKEQLSFSFLSMFIIATCGIYFLVYRNDCSTSLCVLESWNVIEAGEGSESANGTCSLHGETEENCDELKYEDLDLLFN